MTTIPDAAPMPAALRQAAEAATGFMPPAEGLALYRTAAAYAARGPVVEIGTYCGKSTIYLAAAARRRGPGGGHGRPSSRLGGEPARLGVPRHPAGRRRTGRLDTLPHFRATLAAAGLEDQVIAVVGRSAEVAGLWRTPLGMLFIDGGHTDAAATADYESWSPWVALGGALAIHDVFPDPADGGQAPYRIYQRALASGAFAEVTVCGIAAGPGAHHRRHRLARHRRTAAARRRAAPARPRPGRRGRHPDRSRTRRPVAPAERVGGQHHRRRGPAAPLVREVRLVRVLPAGPVRAVGVAQVLDLLEQLTGPVRSPIAVERDAPARRSPRRSPTARR